MSNALLQDAGQVARKFVIYTMVERDHDAGATNITDVPMPSGFFFKGLRRHLTVSQNTDITNNRENKTERNLLTAVAKPKSCFPFPIYLKYLHRTQVCLVAYTIPLYVREKGRCVMVDERDYRAMTTEELIALARTGDKKALKELYLRAAKGDKLASQEIILLGKKGNEDAFKYILLLYKKYIFAIIRNIFRTYSHAKECSWDVFQEVSCGIAHGLGHYEDQFEGAFLHWVGTIATNKSINHIHSCRFGEIFNGPNIEHIIDGVNRQILYDTLLKAIYSLDTEKRNAIILHWLFHCVQRDIAVLMKMKLAKINNLIKSAEEEIRKYLEALNITPTYFFERMDKPEIVISEIPEWGTQGELRGKTHHVKAKDYRVFVAAYTSGWFNISSVTHKTVAIDSDGTWRADITSYADNLHATRIFAALVPGSDNLPVLKDDKILPAGLLERAVAFCQIRRTDSGHIVNVFRLFLNKMGQGDVTLNPTSENYDHGKLVIRTATGKREQLCGGLMYDQGSKITLTATPKQGWFFNHYAASVKDELNPTTLTMDENKSVTAVFSESRPTNNLLSTNEIWYALLGCLGPMSKIQQWAVLLKWILGCSVKESQNTLNVLLSETPPSESGSIAPFASKKKLSLSETADLIFTSTAQVQKCLDHKGYPASSYGL